MIELKPYIDTLKMGKDEINKLLAPAKAHRVKKQAELEMANIEEQIAVLSSDIETECTRENISFSRIIDKQDELELLERRRDQFKETIDQLFPPKKK